MNMVAWLNRFPDITYAVRIVRRNGAFTILTVTLLALGIGANTAIFSVIEALMLRDLPVREPQQLVQLVQRFPDTRITGFPYPFYQEFRDRNNVFSGVCAFTYLPHADLVVQGRAEVIDGLLLASGNYFSVFELRASIGRMFTSSDSRTVGENPVAVISYRFWKHRFNSDPSVVGQSVDINGVSFVISGVLPPRFFGAEVGRSPQIIIPITMQPRITGAPSLLNNYLTYFVTIVGRLQPGVTRKKAQANLAVLFHHAWEQASTLAPPAQHEQIQLSIRQGIKLEVRSAATGVLSSLRDSFSLPLRVLMFVVALILLIACANVASLLFARAVVRQKEVAIRMAVGARRLHIVRQLLSESILLSALGGLGGLLLASLIDKILVNMALSRTTFSTIDVSLDLRVLGFTAAISMLTGIVFGLIPALRTADMDLASALKENFSDMGRGKPHSRLGEFLVIFQVSLSLLLLIGAGLLVMSLRNLKAVNPGFRPNHVLLFSLNAKGNSYRGTRLEEFYEHLREKIGTLPDVGSVSFSLIPPLGGGWGEQIIVPGYNPHLSGDDVVFRDIESPGYFKTMGIPILLGRDFSSRDDAGTTKVAILNKAAVHMYFGKKYPIGNRIGLGPGAQPDTEIVGVVGDTKYNGLRSPVPRLVYTPFRQSTVAVQGVTFEVRTTGKPSNAVAMIRTAVREADNALPLYRIRTLSSQVSDSLARARFLVTLSGLFSGLAVLLACVGLYGVTSYRVSRMRREIGIRMALGAQRHDVFWLVMGRAILLTSIGIGTGVAVGVAFTRFLSSLLYGIRPTDPVTFAILSLMMIAVAALASYFPAHRATQVDPTIAIRSE